jgi:hypothetical protein
MNERDMLWTAANALIEGLGPHFGIWKNPALRVAYDNIYTKLTDQEVHQIINELKRIVVVG